MEATRKAPDAPIIHRNLSDTRKLLSPLVYQKAGWVLHMLRQEVGEEAFWAGIRGYYKRHRDGNVTTEDFRKAMESASKTDLAPFFDQWLKRPGVPKVEGGWKYDPASRKVVIDLAQTQPGEPYDLAVEIGVQATEKDAPTITKIRWNGASKSLEIAADREPSVMKLDPGTKVLMESKFQKR